MKFTTKFASEPNFAANLPVFGNLNEQKFHFKGDNNNLARIKKINFSLNSKLEDFRIDKMTKIIAFFAIIFMIAFIVFVNYYI